MRRQVLGDHGIVQVSNAERGERGADRGGGRIRRGR